MRSASFATALFVLGCLLATATDSSAQQQVTVSTPYQAINDSFFENIGTSWGLRGPNWNLNVNNSPVQAAPQFGGFDPSAGANFGVGFNRGGAQGQFNANLSQGSRRSFTSQTPSVTLQNGVPGYVSDTSQSPFVISYVPVVGGFPTMGSFQPMPPQPIFYNPVSGGGNPAVLQALQEARNQQQPPRADNIGQIRRPDNAAVVPFAEPPARQANLNQVQAVGNDLLLVGGQEAAGAGLAAAAPVAGQESSAARGAMSVAEARRLHAAEQGQQEGEVLILVERGRNAEATGKPNVARIYYETAYRKAPASLRQQIRSRLDALGPPSRPAP